MLASDVYYVRRRNAKKIKRGNQTLTISFRWKEKKCFFFSLCFYYFGSAHDDGFDSLIVSRTAHAHPSQHTSRAIFTLVRIAFNSSHRFSTFVRLPRSARVWSSRTDRESSLKLSSLGCQSNVCMWISHFGIMNHSCCAFFFLCFVFPSSLVFIFATFRVCFFFRSLSLSRAVHFRAF